MWDTKSKDRYLEGLKSHTSTEKIEKLLRATDLNPLQIANEIDDILTSNAKTCAIKKRKVKGKNEYQSSPWFDNECRELQNSISEQGNLLRKKTIRPGH